MLDQEASGSHLASPAVVASQAAAVGRGWGLRVHRSWTWEAKIKAQADSCVTRVTSLFIDGPLSTVLMW
jgi:hypothetical protein